MLVVCGEIGAFIIKKMFAKCFQFSLYSLGLGKSVDGLIFIYLFF